jgi:phage shock protein C
MDNRLNDRRMTMFSTSGTLRRSRRNRVLAGVAGGLGEFFGISAFWFRLAFLIALIPGGVPGLLIYFLMWIIIPSE